MDSPEDVLVEQFIGGDSKAFEKLYNAYKKKIFNYIRRMLGNRETAEELTQETFINIYMNIRRYKPMGMFKSWAYKIASNLAKNELKKKGRNLNISLSEPFGGSEEGATLEGMLTSQKLSPESMVEDKELKENIEKALQALPLKYREALLLCVIDGLSYEEAAEALNTNVKTISSRLARAREAFIRHFNAIQGNDVK